MSRLKSTLRRLQATLKPLLDSEFRAGRRWFSDLARLEPDEYHARQLKRLGGLLAHYAATGLYEPAAKLDQAAALTRDDLEQLPVLTRADLGALFPRLAEAYQGRSDVYRHLTSGATAEPVEFYHSRLLQRRGGGCNLGMYLLMGWHPGMERLCLWGNYRDLGLASRQRRDLKGRLLNWLEPTQRFGGYRPMPADFEQFLDAVEHTPGCAIFGFTAMLEEAARILLDRGERLPAGQVATAWCCSEPLSAAGRKLMAEAFGVSVREHYGSRECAAMATQCAHGHRHINPRYLVEVIGLDDERPVPAGTLGRLLITDLFNDATPMVRYQIGDLGAVEWRDCACGLSGPCLTELAGRITDLIRLPSGRRTISTAFMVVLQDLEGIRRFRTYRHTEREFEVRYTGRELAAPVARHTRQLLSTAMDGAKMRLTHVAELDPSPTGKLIQYVDLTRNGHGHGHPD